MYHAVRKQPSCLSNTRRADLTVQAVNGAWSDDFRCVETIRKHSCTGKRDCPCTQQTNVCVWLTGYGVLHVEMGPFRILEKTPASS